MNRQKHPYEEKYNDSSSEDKADDVWRIIVVVLFCTMVGWAITGCTHHSISDNVCDISVSSREVISIDSIITASEVVDSSATVKNFTDTMSIVAIVTDSVVVETNTTTVITNTVSPDGILLGTDKVTTITRDRDHYRNTLTTNNHKQESSVVSAVTNRQAVNSTTVARYVSEREDSVLHERDSVAQKDNRTWLNRMAERIGSFIIIATAICGIAWIAYGLFRVFIKR